MGDHNDWDVPYSCIRFLEDALRGHRAVATVHRERDILFTIQRSIPLQDLISVVLVNEYTLGLAALTRALREFPDANCVVTGGEWNAYTREAKTYGLQNGIGVFVPSEFMAALWLADFHTYARKDEDGNRAYKLRAA